ncbi:MAG: hypothetical protein Phyf2KO_03140 [Phycisphaerales bacterium]
MVGVTESFILVAEGLQFVAVMGAVLGFVAIAAALFSIAFVVLIPLALLLFVGRAAIVLRAATKSRRSLSVYSSQANGRCHDCGYDISGCYDAIPSDLDLGAGPERCPECASFWPMVPEPTPVEMHRWHKTWFRSR